MKKNDAATRRRVAAIIDVIDSRVDNTRKLRARRGPGDSRPLERVLRDAAMAHAARFVAASDAEGGRKKEMRKRAIVEAALADKADRCWDEVASFLRGRLEEIDRRDILAAEAVRALLPSEMAAPRNAPCPCGSGVKYKRCHLAENAASSGRRETAARLAAFFIPHLPLFDTPRRRTEKNAMMVVGECREYMEWAVGRLSNRDAGPATLQMREVDWNEMAMCLLKLARATATPVAAVAA